MTRLISACCSLSVVLTVSTFCSVSDVQAQFGGRMGGLTNSGSIGNGMFRDGNTANNRPNGSMGRSGNRMPSAQMPGSNGFSSGANGMGGGPNMANGRGGLPAAGRGPTAGGANPMANNGMRRGGMPGIGGNQNRGRLPGSNRNPGGIAGSGSNSAGAALAAPEPLVVFKEVVEIEVVE
jgi:hypothetical protein